MSSASSLFFSAYLIMQDKWAKPASIPRPVETNPTYCAAVDVHDLCCSFIDPRLCVCLIRRAAGEGARSEDEDVRMVMVGGG